ncbi:unnamed protein product [Adineta ricciae]|uniref:Uncharacterized protein n=1 Tax=Adineta ricciae TaxID=249248 RepID=A0A816CWA0_ADIRI|nr:unnamed protein product [Adineta ricciae]CAF1628536.1 unnamed protein product [Adineta ricciae]
MRKLGRQHDDKLNIIRSMATNNGFWSEEVMIPISARTDSAYPNQAQQYHRIEMIISQNCNTPNIEYRSQGTVLTVHTQKALAKDGIIRTTEYVLTHQNLDAQNEVVTDFIKDGDLLPKTNVLGTGSEQNRKESSPFLAHSEQFSPYSESCRQKAIGMLNGCSRTECPVTGSFIFPILPLTGFPTYLHGKQ